MDAESSATNAPDDQNQNQNHRVHIVRVVYQNVAPSSGLAEKEKEKLDGEAETDSHGCPMAADISNDNWSCTTCTVTPCRCSAGGLSAASKCSSCDSFIEAQQQQQEPGPVQLEYSCRCHKDDVNVVKTVCARCATKIHELLADILVCERQDHCRQLAVTTNAPQLGTDVCSNCQVVGARILNNLDTELPPPLPKRKFITRGAVRTPPPPNKCHPARLPPKRRSPPKRRLQRTRSADSPSDSDSSLSDSSEYPNLQYKPGVVPNEYIESDDFPTSSSQNVPFDLSSMRLHDPLSNQQYSRVKSPASSSASPVHSTLSSVCASPASVSHSSPETVSSDKQSPMHTSVSSSKTSSPLNLLDSVACEPGDCVVVTNRKNYTVVDYHDPDHSSVLEAISSTTSDLIDLRSPVACSPPVDNQEGPSTDLSPITDSVSPPTLVTESAPAISPVTESASSVPAVTPLINPDDKYVDQGVKGAEGGACTPASFDIDFIVACDEAGVPDLAIQSRAWPSGSSEDLTDDVFVELRKSGKSHSEPSEPILETRQSLHEAALYARTHRRSGSAGARVDRADSPPPKLPLKPSLSLNQTPPPIPKRDFRTRDRQICGRPHRVSRPQTFDPSRGVEACLPMPDIETNRTVSQLVFSADHVTDDVSKAPERPNQEPLNQCTAQRKKRPLSCLLKPKHTLNKIFNKKSTKDSKDKPPATQRELPPIPIPIPYSDEGEPEVTPDPDEPPPLPVDPPPTLEPPPPLLPRERLHEHLPDLQVAAQHHNFIDSLIKLREVGWYWGPLTMEKAEDKLSGKKDGSFLVRDSSHDSYILSLSFRSQGRTHHTRIEFFHGTFGFWSQPSSHGRMSIVEFIEKAMEHSRNGKFLYFLRPHSPGQAPSPVVLLYPISRYERLQSLQHACRFVILKYVRYDHIEQLPLPNAIKLYLKDNHYFVEQITDSSD